ncbi:hypothetical protein [Nonomuraea sp. NPDC049709]|uniref:hypothetical protein n=1 Tax=Nonomuraea sp. NPDC049709 TaxID=3154736 RepID=UPI00342113C5
MVAIATDEPERQRSDRPRRSYHPDFQIVFAFSVYVIHGRVYREVPSCLQEWNGMDPIMPAAATKLLGAMATDACTQTRTKMVATWRTPCPKGAKVVPTDLDTAHIQPQQASRLNTTDTAHALEDMWCLSLPYLLDDGPTLGPLLQHLPSEHLGRLPFSIGQQISAPTINIPDRADDQARRYITGHDQQTTVL